MDRMGLDLKVEIGVNKFKNGNAQFYHKLGVAPKVPTGQFDFLNFDCDLKPPRRNSCSKQ